MNAALVISARDNVATALEALETGRAIRLGDLIVHVSEPIPRGHKLALHAIRAGEPIVKYGCPIGTASIDITSGAHVHIHNVASARGRGDLRPGNEDRARSATEPGAVPGSRIAEPPDADEPDTAETPGSR